MERDVVGLAEQLLEGRDQDRDVGVLDVRVVREHPHAEGRGALRHLGGDAPDADEAQRLAEQLGALDLLLEELALLHGVVRLDEVVGNGQHEAERQLGHRDRRGGRRVLHLDAALLGAPWVDVVEADAAADDQLQLRGAGDPLGGALGLRAHQRDLGLREPGDVLGDLAELREAVGERLVEGVTDQDHHCDLLFFGA